MTTIGALRATQGKSLRAGPQPLFCHFLALQPLLTTYLSECQPGDEHRPTIPSLQFQNIKSTKNSKIFCNLHDRPTLLDLSHLVAKVA